MRSIKLFSLLLMLVFSFFSHFAHATSNEENLVNVIINPDMNITLVLQKIKEAKHFILLSSLSLPSKKFCQELVKANERGVNILILITNPNFCIESNYDEITKKFSIDKQSLLAMQDRLKRDEPFINILTDNNIYPRFLRRDIYYLNHTKLLIVDDIAFISTSPKHRPDRRDFSLIITEGDKVKALKDFFMRDYNREEHEEGNLLQMGFLTGPERQRERIEELLLSAKKSICIYAADLNDHSICSILEKSSDNGIEVKIIITPHLFGFKEQSLNTNFYMKRLKEKGAHIKILRDPCVHAKVIIVDYSGNDDDKNVEQKMYFGSCNIFKSCLDHSRELGIITSEEKYIEPIMNTFNKDWKAGASF